MKLGFVEFRMGYGYWLFRLLGYGIRFCNHRRHVASVSDRNGEDWRIHCGRWCLKWLPRVKADEIPVVQVKRSAYKESA